MTAASTPATAPVALVTGGASGIGAATAAVLAERGYRLLVTDLDEAGARSVARRIPDATAVGLDVADPAAWARVRDQATERYGGLDVIVNNAYTVVRRPAHQTSEAEWDRQIAVDLTSVYHSVRAFHDTLQARAGAIVNVASVHALVGLRAHPAYAAAKGGVVALTRQLAVEYGPDLRVNAVLPGPILTPAWDHADQAARETSIAGTCLRRFGRPEEVANAIAFLASAEASYITGTTLVVDGGWTAGKDSA